MSINNFTILDLLGFKDLSEQEVARVEQNLMSLAWEKFLDEKLETELGDEGIERVNQMFKEGKTLDEMVGYISQTVPNLKEVLEKSLEDSKTEVIKDYLQNILEESDKSIFNKSLSENQREAFRDKKQDYLKAKELFEKEDYQKFSEVMKENYLKWYK